MNNLFSKENFVFSQFDKQQKRQSLIVSLVMMLLFVFAGFIFLNLLYCFADFVGSIVSGSPDVAIQDLLRSLPIYLSFFMTLWSMLLLHGFFRNVSEERRMKSLYKNAIAVLCFAGINVVYIVVMLIAGKYLSIVEGSPSPWFPLDALLYSLPFIAGGILALLYGKKWAEKKPYLVPSRGPIVKKARFVYCLFVTLWMLIALFGFAGFATGLFIVDFRHYAFYGIALLLVYFVPCFFLVVWEFFYNELSEEKRKEFLLPIALCGLVISLTVIAIYFVALATNIDAPSNMGFGVFPIAFTASVNIATLVVVATPLIVSIVALIKGIIARKQAKPAEQE